jgi:hypothetical protein
MDESLKGTRRHVSYQTRVAVEAILDERKRQDELKKAGRFKYTCADPELSFDNCMMVLVEEVGELCRATIEERGLTSDRPTEFGGSAQIKMQDECIQVAAVALAMVERFVGVPLWLDRKKSTGDPIEEPSNPT